MTRDQQLSDLQLGVIRVLWEAKEATAAEVQKALRGRRKLALTTISTVLSRLEKRGLVSHRTVGRVFIYKPRVSEDAVLHADVSDLTRRWFEGNAAALVSHLLDAKAIGPGELARVRAILESGKGKGGKRRGNR